MFLPPSSNRWVLGPCAFTSPTPGCLPGQVSRAPQRSAGVRFFAGSPADKSRPTPADRWVLGPFTLMSLTHGCLRRQVSRAPQRAAGVRFFAGRPADKSRPTPMAPGPSSTVSAASSIAMASLLLSWKRRRSSVRGSTTAAAAVDDNVRERWCMLIAVSLCSATNAFLCMTFSVLEHLSAQALSVGTMEVAGLYSIWLAVVFVGLTPGTFMTDRYEGLSLVWSALFNVASAVVRVFGAMHGSYNMMVASEILCGVGAWTIFTLPSKVSHRLFPVQQQPLATSIMMQANYMGWLFGIVIPPLLATGLTAFGRVCAWQAGVSLIASAAALLMFAFSKSGVQRAVKVEESLAPRKASGFVELMQTMIKYPRLAIQIVAHGLLGGVSFAAPSAIFFILDNFGFSSAAATAVNTGFVASGIVSGLVLGRLCTHKRSFGRALAICYSACLSSLMACAALAAGGILTGDSAWRLALMILLSILSGSSSLGFIGIGIESASLYPVRSSFVSWGIELVVLASAAILSYMAAGRCGFVVLAVTAAVCALAHFSSFRVDSAGTPRLGSAM